MSKSGEPDRAEVQAAREAYFAGKITAHEYLGLTIPGADQGRRLLAQAKRWLSRLWLPRSGLDRSSLDRLDLDRLERKKRSSRS
ncbi:MAG TPA: hypothetical protein VGK74_05470 [Symbiobacteriaceae bacterium]|jgi:hypothetical protein